MKKKGRKSDRNKEKPVYEPRAERKPMSARTERRRALLGKSY